MKPHVTATRQGGHVVLTVKNSSGKAVKSTRVQAREFVRAQMEMAISNELGQSIVGKWRKVGAAFAIDVK